MKPVYRTNRQITILLLTLLLSAVVASAFVSLLIWACIQHPRLGYTAIGALLGLLVIVKLQLSDADNYLIDHPECNEYEDYPETGGN